MTNNKVYKKNIMILSYFLIIVILFTLCYFFLFLLPYFLVIIIPLTAINGCHIKAGLGYLPTALLYVAVAFMRLDVMIYVLAPVLVMGVVACSIFVKNKCFRGNITVLAMLITLGIILGSVQLCLIYDTDPIYSVAEYVYNSNSDRILDDAKDYYIYEEAIKLESTLTEEEYTTAIELITENVNSLSKNEVLKNYAIYVELILRRDFLKHLFTLSAYLTGLCLFIITMLMKIGVEKTKLLNEGRALELELKKLTIPKGYTLAFYLPITICYLLGYVYNLPAMMYWSLYTPLITVPYGICGMSICADLITKNERVSRYIIATIVLTLGVYVLAIFSIIGLLDKIIDLRKISDILDL